MVSDSAEIDSNCKINCDSAYENIELKNPEIHMGKFLR